jgi:hypothetical protein
MQTIPQITYFRIRGTLGVYAKMIHLILTQAYTGKHYQVKDNPNEIVYPWFGDNYRLFDRDITLNASEDELLHIHNETKDVHNQNINKKDFVIVHKTPVEEAACVYRAQLLRQNVYNYDYHYKKMLTKGCFLSYEAFKFYRENSLWLLNSYTDFMEKRARPETFTESTLPFHNINWIIDNYQQVTKKYINDANYQQGMHSHAQEILLDDIRSVEGFQDTFKINMSEYYKPKWEFIQRYGQIMEQSFVDFHSDRSYN